MITKAVYEDLEQILALQKLAYQSEAEITGDYTIPPLTQTLDSIRKDFNEQVILKNVEGGSITGSVRAFENGGVCHIGRLIVHPERQNKGLGKLLMRSIEQEFSHCGSYLLFTGEKSERNLYFYGSLGYKAVREKKVSDKLTLVYLEKSGRENVSGQTTDNF